MTDSMVMGNDHLNGGDGGDTIEGGDDDIIRGGQGDDIIAGGYGDDIYVFIKMMAMMRSIGLLRDGDL